MKKIIKIALLLILLQSIVGCSASKEQVIINTTVAPNEQELSTDFALGDDLVETVDIYISDEIEQVNDYFYIEFIDVGQADAIFVSCNGHNALIDGGNPSDSDLLFSFLKSNEINHLDFVINTHPDEDHIGGLAGALNFASVDYVYAPVKEWETEAFNNFVKYVNKQGAEINMPYEGQILELGDAKFEILSSNLGTDSNSKSIVTMINYKDSKVLLTGDANEKVETYLIENKNLECDLLKIAHHGSEYSTSYLFLKECNPNICVISVGKNNIYGHPSELVLSKIDDLGAKLYRTDLNGNIRCDANSGSFVCEVEKKKH